MQVVVGVPVAEVQQVIGHPMPPSAFGVASSDNGAGALPRGAVGDVGGINNTAAIPNCVGAFCSLIGNGLGSIIAPALKFFAGRSDTNQGTPNASVAVRERLHGNVARQPEASINEPRMTGKLVKEPVGSYFGSSKARWMVLLHDRIEWRDPSYRSITRGAISLSPYTEVYFRPTEHGHLRVVSEGRELILHSALAHGKQKELAEWANAIHKQIQLISSSRRQPTSATIWWDQPRGDYD